MAKAEMSQTGNSLFDSLHNGNMARKAKLAAKTPATSSGTMGKNGFTPTQKRAAPINGIKPFLPGTKAGM